MDDENLGTVSITYARTNDDELNKKLDDSASRLGGRFDKQIEQDDICIRDYNFEDEDMADLFIEQANFIISRHFPFEPIDVEEWPIRARWTFEEAVYHHIEFESMPAAQRFATWLRAAFSTYLEIEMFDVFMLKPLDENSGPMVIYAFPFQSVIPQDMVEDDLSEIEDLLSTLNVKKGSGGLLN